MKNRLIHPIVALLLTLSMLLGVLPTSIFAAETSADTNTEATAQSSMQTVLDVRPIAAQNTITPLTTMMEYHYGNYVSSGGVFPLRTGSDLTLLGDAAFCAQHQKPTPYNGREMSYVGSMSEYNGAYGELTTINGETLTDTWAYRVIKSAQEIMNDRAYSSLTIYQKLHAVQLVIQYPDKLHTNLGNSQEGGSYTALQAQQMYALYKAIDTMARASTLELPKETPLTYTKTGGDYFSGSNYVIATYRLNYSGVTARSVSSSQGVNCSVSGTTLTVSIPASKMQSGWNSIYYAIVASAPTQTLETIDLYVEGTGDRQMLLLYDEKEYSPTASISGSIQFEVGNVEIRKVDAADQSKGLAGAVFTITNRDNGQTIPLPATDANGYTTNTQPLPIGRYTITETTAPAGYTKTDWSQDFVITANSTSKLSYTVTNTAKTGSWTPKVTKVLEGADLTNGQFTFILSENGKELQRATNKADGTVTFETIQYTPDDIGEHTYTVNELRDGQPDITYDTHTLTYTVMVNDVDDSELMVFVATEGSTTFTNSVYKKGSWTPTATKVLSRYVSAPPPVYSLRAYSSELSEGQFTFILCEDGQEIQRVTNKADGTITFDEIFYTTEDIGTHTYTITEVYDGQKGIHYDYHTLTYTVTVSDEGGDDLVIRVSSFGSTVFENSYDCTEVTVTKIWVDNNNQDGTRPTEITVTIKGSDGSTYSATFGGTGDEWTYTFTDLPKYGNTGELITYTIESENAVPGYTPSISGDTITNIHSPDETAFTVHKKWVDGNNQDGIRPTEITVTIKGSDGKIYTATFSGTGDDWSYTFTGLPMYEDGEPITYTVESENAVPGYEASIEDDTITNTHTPAVTDITARKVWYDGNNKDGLRTDVQLILTGSDGNTYTGVIRLGTEDPSYTWKDLPMYADGELIVYKLEEVTVFGYTSEINKVNGEYLYIVNNTHTPEETTYTVYKKWVDGNDQDGIRPTEITVTIVGSNGKTYTATFSGSGDDWSYTFTGLPMYEDGKPITYMVESENAVPGYETSIEDDTITNTHTPAVTDITARKVWYDGNNQDGLRTDVQLILTGSDGNTYTGVIRLGTEDPSYTWKDLPMYADGELIVYKLEEVTVFGYTSEIKKVDGEYLYIVNNTHTPEETTYTVYKKWVDGNDQDGIRPAEITVTIVGSNGKTYTATFGGSGDDWSYTFKNLPKYANGKLITYEIVSENAVPGYTPSISGDTITNTHTPAVTDVTATKVWDDNNNQDGLRKDVYLTLTGSDGSKRTGTIKLGETTYTWTDLPVYMDGGQLIQYTLTEAKIDGYTSEISVNGYSFTVTNTHVPEVIEIDIRKVWVDRGDEWKVRPANITFVLYGSDGSERMATVRGTADEWSYTFTDLPKYWGNGELIEYTLEELPVHGYTTEIEKGDDGYTFTVTNTLVYGRLHITKTAEDELVEGLRFRIYGVSHQGTTVDIVVVTGADGVARVDYILPGYYYVEEIDVPERYETPARQTVIVIGDDSDPEITTLSFDNVLKRMSITIHKTAEDSILEGHKFRLTGVDWLGDKIDLIGVTDENGVIVFENLLAAEYTVEEIETGERYVVPDEQTVDLKWGENESISFHNALKRMSITVNKIAEDGVLTGHKFRLTGTDYLNNEIDIIGTTDENGTLSFLNLLAGEYTVTEVETDIRYVVPDDQTVDLTWGKDEIVNVHNELKRMTITVNKTAEDGVLEGHKFRLTGTDYLNNEIDIIGTTDKNGKLIFDNLLAGTYTVTEVDTDIRYVVPDDQVVNLTWGVDENVNVHNELKRMSITVNKTAEDKILAGHKFRLTGTDYLDNKIDLIGVTDEDGVIVFENLLKGKYAVEEIETGIQYVVPDDQEVSITWGEDEDVNFKNDLKYWKLTVVKTDSTTCEAVEGAVYGIYLNGVLLDEYVTDKNGSFTTKEYLCGEGYTLGEISPAPGFTLDFTEYALDGARPEHCTLALTELGADVTDEPTHVVITKTDITTGDPVEGAEIVIYDAEGNEVFRGVTDENGILEAFYLPVGVYTFVETIPASGYTLNPNSFTFEIHEDGSITGDTEFTDEPTHVVITKKDITTGNPLPGAEITIYDADGNVVFKAVTDENGEIEAFYLPVGVYTFKETYNPDGFKINTNTFTFEIHADGSITGDTEIEDEPYTITLSKLESTSKAPVQGAVIEVYGKEGDLIGQYTTDVNGEIFIRELIPGVYTYKEIYAPNGYVLDDTLHTFILNEDGSVSGEITFENARIEPTAPKTGDHTLLLGSIALFSFIGTVLFIGKRKRRGPED